jgi:hypothetical protein
VRARLMVVGLLILGAAAVEAQRPAQETPDLPVRRVILYKSGVGFFEHVGSVTGNANVTIQFTTAQLNDVLQSLTAIDLDGGSIANISYNSIAPIEQRLSALRMPMNGNADRLALYQSLRGARVEVHSGAATDAIGRIFAVERKTRQRNGASEPVLEMTLVTDEGTIRTVELTPSTSVRLAERDVRDDLSSYLGIVASTRSEDVRRMVLSASGTGSRRLAVSYISEVPIWKSTYRLVLPDAGRKPVLQGWAVVDNTIGQDWANVELSLVAGAPQSFVQQISQPYYLQRPVVPLPRSVQLQPQTHAATLTSGGGVQGTMRDPSGSVIPGVTVRLLNASGASVDDAVTDAGGNFTLHAAPGTYTLRAELPGFTTMNRQVTVGGLMQRLDAMMSLGGVSESVTVDALRAAPAGRGGGVGGGFASRGIAPPPPPPPPAPVIDYMAGLSAPTAAAQELGDLFEYKMRQPVTIRKNESALVPILNAEVDAERVSIWNRGVTSGRPLRGVWLTNTSALTLDGGSFTVIDANAFAGEGLVESLKPGEKRLVSYGADLAVVVKASQGEGAGRVTKIVAKDGVLIASQEDRATWKYTARNEDTSARTLVIEHPLRQGWSVGTDPAPAETSPTAARYRLNLPSKQEAALTVTERHAGDVSYRLIDFDDRTIAVLIRGGVPEAGLRRALQPLTDKRAELAAAEAKLSSIETQIAEIAGDQDRVRENMKALRGSDEEKSLTQRYTRQLNEQEDRLAALRADQKKATADRDARRRELSELAAKLAFEI